VKLSSLLVLALVWSTSLDREDELSELRDEARTILEDRQALEITTSEARRKVQLLLNEFRAWADRHDVELQSRVRQYRSPEAELDEMLTADRCPLFFEEELNELCPLDLGRSEVWGGKVVHCRYDCE